MDAIIATMVAQAWHKSPTPCVVRLSREASCLLGPSSLSSVSSWSPAVPSAGCGCWWSIQAHNAKRNDTRSRCFPTGNELSHRVTFVIPSKCRALHSAGDANGNPHVGSKIPRVRGRASGLGEDSQIRQGAPDVSADGRGLARGCCAVGEGVAGRR